MSSENRVEKAELAPNSIKKHDDDFPKEVKEKTFSFRTISRNIKTKFNTKIYCRKWHDNTPDRIYVYCIKIDVSVFLISFFFLFFFSLLL